MIDPVRHRTAQRADWHIPIRPGTDGALALAMMHVIITEGLHRRGVRPRPHRRASTSSPSACARTRRSGRRRRPASRPRTSARWPASTPPPTRSMIRIGVAIERHAGGGQTVRSIACLPALVGAWRQVGGGLLQLPLWAFPVNWAGVHAPRARHPGHAGGQPVPAGPGADRRAGAGPADHRADGLQLQPDGRVPRTGQDRAPGWPARTCSRWSATTSSPTPRATPTSCCPRRPSSSSTTSCSAGATSTSRSTPRPSSRWARRCPTPSCSAGSRRAWASTTSASPHRRGDAGARPSTGRRRRWRASPSSRCARPGGRG